MFNFQKLMDKYNQDAAFNKVVNLHKQLLSEYGFLPSEIREAAFIAQYMYELNHAERIIRSDKEWEAIAKAREIMKAAVVNVKNICESPNA